MYKQVNIRKDLYKDKKLGVSLVCKAVTLLGREVLSLAKRHY
jgi:hypothetical protein